MRDIMSQLNEIPIKAYGVAVVVIRMGFDEDQFLLVKRTRPPVGAWTYVAGGIESGEKAYVAAVREVHEETGLGVVALYSADLCEQFFEINKNSIWIAPVFVAFVEKESTVRINEEHSEYCWCTVAKAAELLTFPGTAEIVEKVNRHFVEETPNPFLRIEVPPNSPKSG